MDQYLGHRIIINLTEDIWNKIELLIKYLTELEAKK